MNLFQMRNSPGITPILPIFHPTVVRNNLTEQDGSDVVADRLIHVIDLLLNGPIAKATPQNGFDQSYLTKHTYPKLTAVK